MPLKLIVVRSRLATAHVPREVVLIAPRIERTGTDAVLAPVDDLDAAVLRDWEPL